jgi:hypothetical protein
LAASCGDDDTSLNSADVGVDTTVTLACGGRFVSQPVEAANHVAEPAPIVYGAFPPAGGAHRPFWARWGEYSVLPPEIYIHNLEHGGMVLLYSPDTASEDVDVLREWARLQDLENGGSFRWILTPIEGLQTPVAAVAWGWVYEADCVDVEGLDAFRDEHYRQAPEDVGADGSYQDNYLGRL